LVRAVICFAFSYLCKKDIYPSILIKIENPIIQVILDKKGLEMEAIEATVVSTVPVGMFDDPLFSSLKELTYEQLLTNMIETIDALDLKELTDSDFKEVALLKVKNKQNLHNLVLLFGESWRREPLGMDPIIITVIMNFLEDEQCVFCNETKSIDYCLHTFGPPGQTEPYRNYLRVRGIYVTRTSLFCSPCKIKHSLKTTRQNADEIEIKLIDEVKGWLDMRKIVSYRRLRTDIKAIRPGFELRLLDMQMVKGAMLKILTTPLLTKELEECMDEILDLNGNKISQMKDYLTEEQYRFVRSGNHFEEFPKQQELLTNLKKMRDALKPKVTPVALHVLS
jgi:hypothetical protein